MAYRRIDSVDEENNLQVFMASLLSNQGSDSDTSLDSNRKKRRKIVSSETSVSVSDQAVKWRLSSVQRIYTVKLVQALQRARQHTSTTTEADSGVRLVADRVLAMAAKGTTRWSRAILASRLRLCRLRKHKKAKNPDRLRKVPAPLVESLRRRKLPQVEKKVKMLSRLIPGCRGLPVTNLLEETGDYIAALEMQVRAMTAIAELLTGAQSHGVESASSS